MTILFITVVTLAVVFSAIEAVAVILEVISEFALEALVLLAEALITAIDAFITFSTLSYLNLAELIPLYLYDGHEVFCLNIIVFFYKYKVGLPQTSTLVLL